MLSGPGANPVELKVMRFASLQFYRMLMLAGDSKLLPFRSSSIGGLPLILIWNERGPGEIVDAELVRT